MSVKINTDSIDKINSEYRQRSLKRMKESEEAATHVASEDKVELSSKAIDLKQMQTKTI